MLFPLLAFSMDESKELSLQQLGERTGMTKGNLEIVLGELTKAGLVKVERRKGGREGGLAVVGGMVPKDESSERTSTTSSTSAVECVSVSLLPRFHSKHKRLTILPKKMEEDKEKGMGEDILKERTLKCQAILVRIMKLKKTMAYRELVVEVVRQCKHAHFTPEVSFVRRVVEGLIETEYLRRAPEKREWLEYMA